MADYSNEAQKLRVGLGARTLGLFVIDGPRGSGFSIVTEDEPESLLDLAEMLESSARKIRADLKARSSPDPESLH